MVPQRGIQNDPVGACYGVHGLCMGRRCAVLLACSHTRHCEDTLTVITLYMNARCAAVMPPFQQLSDRHAEYTCCCSCNATTLPPRCRVVRHDRKEAEERVPARPVTVAVNRCAPLGCGEQSGRFQSMSHWHRMQRHKQRGSHQRMRKQVFTKDEYLQHQQPYNRSSAGAVCIRNCAPQYCRKPYLGAESKAQKPAHQKHSLDSSAALGARKNAEIAKLPAQKGKNYQSANHCTEDENSCRRHRCWHVRHV